MYITKSSKGFRWYTTVKKNDKGQDTSTQYINFTFKKDCEPRNLNDKGSYEADLYLIDKLGNKRKVFPYVNEWQDHKSVEFKILDVEEQGNTDPRHDVNVEPDELPFY